MRHRSLIVSSTTYTLLPIGAVTTGATYRVQWRLEGSNGREFVLHHGVPADHAALLGPADRADSALVSVLLHVMEHGSVLRVLGSVSPTLLAGLDATQEVWMRWRPSRYRRIAIEADHESELAPHDHDCSTAICAFSGGVDASFTLFRHLLGHAGRATRDLARVFRIP